MDTKFDTTSITIGVGLDALHPASPQAMAAKPRIEELRKQLLDLSTRNRLLNFKHNARGGRFIRVVDDSAIDLFNHLKSDEAVEFIGVPNPPDEPDDETSEEFTLALEEALLTDKAYLKVVDQIEDSPSDDSEAKLRKAERALRDRLRKKLGLESRGDVQMSAKDYARKLGINPEFDLGATRRLMRSRPKRNWQTLYSQEDLARRLRGIEQIAREARQEYGVETLFVVYGFLEWSPPTPAGESEDVLFSPLILCPVGIERKTPGSSRNTKGDLLIEDEDTAKTKKNRETYLISAANSDDPMVNLTLRERLRQDHGIVLPELDPEAPNAEVFFAQVERIIRDFPNWRLRRFVTLTHLSFSRLPMWADLDPEVLGKIEPYRHPLIGELFGGREPSDSDARHEGTEPTKSSAVPALVMDCDSSQYAAIKKVLSGKNLVIQGPPGTGKSQTIANLIGAALNEGKSVLFVAEKQVALEVVNKRLTEVGLGDYLLELHSAKAGKKDFISSIKNRLEIVPGRWNERDDLDARAHHRSAETALDNYAKAINSPYGATNWTLHDIIWKEVGLSDKSMPEAMEVFTFINVKNWTTNDWVTRRAALIEWEQIEAARAVQSDQFGESSTWEWVEGDDLHIHEQRCIIHLLREIITALNEISDYIDKNDLRLPVTQSVNYLRGLTTSLGRMGSRPLARPGMWSFAQKPEAADLVAKLIQAAKAQESARSAITGIAPGALINPSEVPQLIDWFTQTLGQLSRNGSLVDVASLHTQYGQNQADLACVNDTAELLGKLSDITQIKELIGNPDGPSAVALIIELGATRPPQINGRKINFNNTELASIINDAICQARNLQEEERILRNKLMVPLDSVSVDEASEAVKELSEGFFITWLFRPLYRKACRLVERIAPAKGSEEVIEILKSIIAHKAAIANLAAHPAAVLTDNLFMGKGSNLPVLISISEWSESIRRKTPIIHPLSTKIRNAIWSMDDDLSLLTVDLKETNWLEKFDALALVCNSARTAPCNIGQLLQRENQLIGDLLALCDRWQLTSSISPPTRDRLVLNSNILISSTAILAAHSAECALLLPDYEISCNELRKVKEVIIGVKNTPLPALWIDKLIAEDGMPSWMALASISSKLDRLIDGLKRSFDELAKHAKTSENNKAQWSTLSITDLVDQFKASVKNEQGLITHCRLLASITSLRNLGLESFIQNLGAKPSDYNDAGSFFERIAIRNLCQQAFSDIPELHAFRHLSPRLVRERFRSYDVSLKKHDLNRMLHKIQQRYIPPGVGVGRVKDRTELALLKHIAGQQQPRTSVREIMRRSGRALQALKPCFMMSPLSVAQLIERDAITFDLVVFDEASQVRPEDAISAITRARQFVVVGDPMQLPPTSFGLKTNDSAGSSGEEDDEENSAVVESILDLATSAYGNPTMLLWHYRSRDPSLIAYSNREFYDRRLQVFPAPNRKNEHSGVRFVEVPGLYSARTNVIEARATAKAAIAVMLQYPERSIGIVALNRPQADLIELELDRLIDQSEAALDYKAEWGEGLEPLFVKNLESVQGDERDIILISTVFGHDENGNFHQRFGPINSSAGHRRLNVLFTRAKHQVIVLSSIPIEKIQLKDGGHWGVRALKGYLEYAKYGRINAGTTTGRSADSPFEEAVCAALTQHGYQCEPQIGVDGFFIDLGVRHPTNPDHFILGIECDGATYHSSRSARDRDRLRQEILENLGWEIYRIWSSDWFTDPRSEINKLVSHIRNRLRVNPTVVKKDSVNFKSLIQEVIPYTQTEEKDDQPFELQQSFELKLPLEDLSTEYFSPEAMSLMAEIISSESNARLRKQLEEAFGLSKDKIREIELPDFGDGALAFARLVEGYNRQVYLWHEANKKAPLSQMPWLSSVSLQDRIRLRAQAIRDVISRFRS